MPDSKNVNFTFPFNSEYLAISGIKYFIFFRKQTKSNVRVELRNTI